MKKTFFLLAIYLLIAVMAFAQDKIYTKLQSTPIVGEVTEITTNEIKYKPKDRPLPIVSIDKQDVIKIVYSNGEVMMINNPLKDYTMYSDQHHWNLKMSLLSPLLGHTQFFLERSMKPGRSIEYELNLIGPGKNQEMYDDYGLGGPDEHHLDAIGGGIGIGLKILKLPDYVNGQIRLRHIMQGSYLKPAISFNVYGRNFAGYNNILERKTVFAVNPNLTIGKQWILDNTVSIDIYGAIGYSFDNVRANQKAILNDAGFYQEFYDNVPFNSFGYTRFGSGDFGLSLGGGIRVGFLFDFRKDKEKER